MTWREAMSQLWRWLRREAVDAAVKAAAKKVQR